MQRHGNGRHGASGATCIAESSLAVHDADVRDGDGWQDIAHASIIIRRLVAAGRATAAEDDRGHRGGVVAG